MGKIGVESEEIWGVDLVVFFGFKFLVTCWVDIIGI